MASEEAERHRDFLNGIRDGRKIVMHRCDLSGLDLSGMDLRSAEFMACDFSGATIRSANFGYAQLLASRFDQADLTDSDFTRAGLRAATFEYADLTGVRLIDSDLRDCAIYDDETNVIGSPLASTFRRALLRGTDMSHCKMKRVMFNYAIVDQANFANADLRDASFLGAEVMGADLAGARLDGVREPDRGATEAQERPGGAGTAGRGE